MDVASDFEHEVHVLSEKDIALIIDKSPWDSTAEFIFFCHISAPLKQCILFEIFLHFSLPPPYTKLKLGKEFFIHASKIVRGVRGGVGPV